MHKLFLGLLLLSVVSIHAQRPQNSNPIKITGTVIDKDTGDPLEYATFIVQSVREPDKVTGGITNENGQFNVETVPGMYNISVEYISYATYKKERQLLRANTDLGKIEMSIDVAQLDEVEVIAERTTVELRLDKKDL